MGIDIKISPSQDAIGKHAAKRIKQLLELKPDAVIGMATGSTPEPMYAELVRMHKEEGLDFSRATFFNLDEYAGLRPDHPESYHAYMQTHLYDHINADPAKIHILDGKAKRLGNEVLTFEAKIKAAGGIDLQILGIGTNGHIGFCEPGTSFNSRTHVVKLAQSTRQDNARFFGGKVSKTPEYALTMGIQTIMDAKRIILLANGEGKAAAIRSAAQGPVSPNTPASILQEHDNVTFMLDPAAAQSLDRSVTRGTRRP